MSKLGFPLLALVLSTTIACEWRIVDAPYDSSRGGEPSGIGVGADDGASSASCSGRAGAKTCANATPPSTCSIEVNRFKELLVIHQSVLLDRRAQNATNGAWSFRARMEDLAGASDAPEMTRAWLDSWKTVTSVGADYAPVTPRPGVDGALVTPWLAKSGSPRLSMPLAPFRLIAIVNRPDLREEVDGCSGEHLGELRFVYTAEDPATNKAIPMTVIVEVPYPPTRTARGWIDAWHALGQMPFGADYNDALAAITTEALASSKRETWRVRTNEIAFVEESNKTAPSTAKASWEMRELRFDVATNRLVFTPLQSTPRIDLDNSRSLDVWANENTSSILNGTYVLPGGLQAGAAPIPQAFFQWSRQSTSMAPAVRDALGMSTCNGCHGGERAAETALPFQHIAAPDQKTQYYGTANNGETRLSSWLDNPENREGDELSRRERSMTAALCASSCKGASSVPPNGAYAP